MATFTYTVDNSVVPEVVNAICFVKDYQDTIDGLPNPETKNNFATRMLTEEFTRNLKRAVQLYRRNQAGDAGAGVESDYTGKIT